MMLAVFWRVMTKDEKKKIRNTMTLGTAMTQKRILVNNSVPPLEKGLPKYCVRCQNLL
ncbi:MAG: hypothetical protein G01um101420_923 [Parcubacteria group bacterium Gr01-1014_20]|nr:MAG: hypothetical protein G01um101420_923 [Parcubacteria group bacterium Gr01-1014_20]